MELVRSIDVPEPPLIESVQQLQVRFNLFITDMPPEGPDTFLLLRINGADSDYASFASLLAEDTGFEPFDTAICLGRTAFFLNADVSGSFSLANNRRSWRVGNGLVTYASVDGRPVLRTFGWECYGFLRQNDSHIRRIEIFKDGPGTVTGECWIDVSAPAQTPPHLTTPGNARNDASEVDIAGLALAYNDLANRFNELKAVLASSHILG